MKYENPVYRSDFEAEQDALSGDVERASRGIVYLTLYGESDPATLETIVMRCIQSESLRGVCCVGLGHLARRFGRLSLYTLVTLREIASSHIDEDVRGMAEDALEVFNIPTGSTNTLD